MLINVSEEALRSVMGETDILSLRWTKLTCLQQRGKSKYKPGPTTVDFSSFCRDALFFHYTHPSRLTEINSIKPP